MTPIAVLLVLGLATSDWPTVRTDAEGVGLPPGVIARIGSTRFRHEHPCHGLHFTADGKRLIGATAEQLHGWNISTGSRTQLIPHRGEGALLASTLRSDGAYLRIANSNEKRQLVTYNANDGSVLKQLPVSADGDINTFSPDGTRLAQWHSGLLMVFDTTTMKDVHSTRFSIADFEPSHLAISADNKLVVACFNQWAEVRELATGNVMFSGASELNDNFERVALSPNGKELLRIARGEEKHRLQWIDCAKDKVRTLLECEHGLYHPVFSHDGKSCYVIRGWDLIRVDLQTQKVTKFGNAGLAPQHLVLSPDGKLIASAGFSHRVILWDTQTGNELPQSSDPISVHEMTLEFVANGRRIAVYDSEGFGNGGGQLYEVASGKLLKNLPIYESGFVQFLPSGEEFAVSTAEKIEVRNVATDRPSFSYPFTEEQERIPAIRMAGNGRYLFADGLQKVHYWDLQTKTKPEPFVSKDLDFLPTPDGKSVLKVRMKYNRNDGQDAWVLELHDLTTRLPHPEWSNRPSHSRVVVFDPTGRAIVTENARSEFALLELNDGRQRWRIPTDEAILSHGSFSHDGRSLALRTGGSSVNVYEACTGKLRLAIPTHEYTRATAFSPDHRYLAVLSPTAPLHLHDFRGELLKFPQLLDRQSRTDLWDQLLGDNAELAFRALRRMAAAPESALSVVRAKVKPAVSPPKEKVEELIKLLDAPAFRDRESATKELKLHADKIEGELRQAEQTTASPEVRQRLEKLRAATFAEAPESVRRTRIVELVEWCGTPDAKKLLQEWANGAKGASLTREATEALTRMAR